MTRVATMQITSRAPAVIVGIVHRALVHDVVALGSCELGLQVLEQPGQRVVQRRGDRLRER